MTLEEKVGQMLTSLGWPMYERVGEDIRLTPQLEKEIGEYHIGSLWGFMRADPWTQRTLHTGLNPSLAARASNRLQSYVIEHSRLGIPLFLAEECPHGHMAIGTTVFPLHATTRITGQVEYRSIADVCSLSTCFNSNDTSHLPDQFRIPGTCLTDGRRT